MNKPVATPFAWYCAWLGDNDEPVWEQYEECHPAKKQWDNFPDKIIPLYTHPVKEEYFEDEPQAEELYEILQSNAELTDKQALEKKYEKRNVELQNMIIRLNAQIERLKSTIYHQETYAKYLENNYAILRKAQEK